MGKPADILAIDCHYLVTPGERTLPGGSPFVEHTLDVNGEVPEAGAVPPYDGEPETVITPVQGQCAQ